MYLFIVRMGGIEQLKCVHSLNSVSTHTLEQLKDSWLWCLKIGFRLDISFIWGLDSLIKTTRKNRDHRSLSSTLTAWDIWCFNILFILNLINSLFNLLLRKPITTNTEHSLATVKDKKFKCNSTKKLNPCGPTF